MHNPRDDTASVARVPAEFEPHARTVMAFGAQDAIWGAVDRKAVERELSAIALAISHFEPVLMLVRGGKIRRARNLMGSDVELAECPLDDIWIRDTGPILGVDPAGSLVAIDGNFNGWGGKQACGWDRHVATRLAGILGVGATRQSLVLEGGAIEFDGTGTAMTTRSNLLAPSRNPWATETGVEAVLRAELGIERLLWLSGIRGSEITDGHVDFYARFAPGNRIILHQDRHETVDRLTSERHLGELHRTLAEHFPDGYRVSEIGAPPPDSVDPADRADHAGGYCGFYACNGGVIVQEFGDSRTDGVARDLIEDCFPGRRIVTVRVDAVAAGGGTVHCVTLPVPESNRGNVA